MIQYAGVDFGTTNSVVALLRPDGSVTSLSTPTGALFRTVLSFSHEVARGRDMLHHHAGPAAIAAYLEDPLDTRLILSMKSYLAQRSFSHTTIHGRRMGLEQMVALFLRALLGEAITPETRIIAGRPVRFAGEFADDALGEQRLRAAYAEAGFPHVTTALEPEGAGYRFASTLAGPAVVLVGDFGGGTSDFSVLRFDGRRVTPLGYAGVGIAGDVFDYRIIDHVISPHLGKGMNYRVMGEDLPVPAAYFSSFARWHQLSLMRAPKTLREIEEVARASEQPERLRRLVRLIEQELGYALYQSVAATKSALSAEEATTLRFDHAGITLEERVTRADFESWIAADLARLGEAVDRALASAGLGAGDVDRVFLTGGTSFVPAVRALFSQRFGAGRVSSGGEFLSVAEGLALIGRGAVAQNAD